MIKKQIGKVFPNINATLAYYSPTSFSVTLNTIDEAQYASILKKISNIKEAENYSIIIHELRHHLDHISTLWGQKHILKLFNAVNARITPNEFGFHELLPLKITEQQFHYDTYYSVQVNKVEWKSPADNWQWRLSSGVKFDMNGNPDETRPILFINFATQTGQHINRVPISIAALLETGAIRDELEVMFEYIKKLPKDEGLVESKLLSTRIFAEIIYNQYMAVYNSVVHLTANTLRLSDTVLALYISSALSLVSLNLPHELATTIPIPKIALDTWKDRCAYLIKNHDQAFIFYCLLINYKPIYEKDKTYSLERLLKANNLPPSKAIIEKINDGFDRIAAEISSKENFQQQFLSILKEGKRLFQVRGLDGTNMNPSSIMKKHNYNPFVLCNDTDFELEEYVINTGLKRPMDNLDPEQWYSFAMTVDEKFDEFFNIRGL